MKKEREERIYKITLLVLLALAICVLYLFALNGRYRYIEHGALVDKWKQEYVVVK